MTIVVLLSGLSALSALAYGIRLVHHRPSLLRTLVKGTSVATLALISGYSGAPPLLTLALGLGTIGDVFLSRDGERNFLLGLSAFLLGHLAYIGLLRGAGAPLVDLSSTPWKIGACVVLLGVAAVVVRRLLPHLGALRIPVLIYAVVIVAMGISAFSLPSQWPYVLAVVGAILFIASDAILGFELFVFREASSQRTLHASLLWVLYWGGQALIACAFVLAA